MQTIYKNYSYQLDRRLPVAKQRKKIWIYPAIVLLVLLCVLTFAAKSAFLSGNGGSSVSRAAATGNLQEPEETEKPAPAPPPPKRQIDTSALKPSLELITKRYPYNTSVAVVDLNSGTLIRTGDDYPFIAASTTKLLTALLYFSKVEAGQESLDTSIGGRPARDQLKLAVNRSDNGAWHKLNDHMGKENLDAYAKQHNLKSYDAVRNTITSDDMAKLMADIYNRKLINDSNTKLLLSWMQKTSEERFIPAGVPEGMAVYHKAGYLPDRVHDVAIIDNGSAPFVIVIYSKSYTATYDYPAGQKLFKQVTEQVVTTFK